MLQDSACAAEVDADSREDPGNASDIAVAAVAEQAINSSARDEDGDSLSLEAHLENLALENPER